MGKLAVRNESTAARELSVVSIHNLVLYFEPILGQSFTKTFRLQPYNEQRLGTQTV